VTVGRDTTEGISDAGGRVGNTSEKRPLGKIIRWPWTVFDVRGIDSQLVVGRVLLIIPTLRAHMTYLCPNGFGHVDKVAHGGMYV
jgi:hypothetical protein